jgi:hypothetical protein
VVSVLHALRGLRRSKTPAQGAGALSVDIAKAATVAALSGPYAHRALGLDGGCPRRLSSQPVSDALR